MNTKTYGISSGLVAVAWMMQSPDGQCMGFLPFTEEGTAPVVRLSDADEIISAKDAEINEQCRINGMGAERELHLLAQVAAKDAEIERLKAMLPDIPKRERECKSIEDWKARALYLESEYASCSHGFNSHAGKQSDRIKELEAFSRNAANGLLLREKQLAQQSAALKLASLALSEGVEYVEEPPEKNCTCHLSPPCNDCVDHSAVREFFIDARKALAAIDALGE